MITTPTTTPAGRVAAFPPATAIAIMGSTTTTAAAPIAPTLAILARLIPWPLPLPLPPDDYQAYCHCHCHMNEVNHTIRSM